MCVTLELPDLWPFLKCACHCWTHLKGALRRALEWGNKGSDYMRGEKKIHVHLALKQNTDRTCSAPPKKNKTVNKGRLKTFPQNSSAGATHQARYCEMSSIWTSSPSCKCNRKSSPQSPALHGALADETASERCFSPVRRKHHRESYQECVTVSVGCWPALIQIQDVSRGMEATRKVLLCFQSLPVNH